MKFELIVASRFLKRQNGQLLRQACRLWPNNKTFTAPSVALPGYLDPADIQMKDYSGHYFEFLD
jgi:hypothetical protein